MHTGLLLLRLAVGAALVSQGASKARRQGHAEMAAFLDGAGYRPARFLAALTAATELGAGLLLLAGLATPLAAAAAVGVLVNAVAFNRVNGWRWTAQGIEYPVVLAAATATLVLTGAGDASLDAVLGVDQPSAAVSALLLAGALVVALPVLVDRERRRSALAG